MWRDQIQAIALIAIVCTFLVRITPVQSLDQNPIQSPKIEKLEIVIKALKDTKNATNPHLLQLSDRDGESRKSQQHFQTNGST